MSSLENSNECAMAFSKAPRVGRSVGNTELRILLESIGAVVPRKACCKIFSGLLDRKNASRVETNGEKYCLLLFFSSGFPAQRLLVPSSDSSEGAPRLQPHSPARPVPPRGLWRNPPIKRNRRSYMKIITNVALAACVGLSLGWMASCSTEHVTETTTTREVDTVPPPPAIVTAAPVITEPVVTVPPNASTTSTTTQFNNGTVEKKTVTEYNSAYPPVVTSPAPVVVTTTPAEPTT